VNSQFVARMDRGNIALTIVPRARQHVAAREADQEDEIRLARRQSLLGGLEDQTAREQRSISRGSARISA